MPSSSLFFFLLLLLLLFFCSSSSSSPNSASSPVTHLPGFPGSLPFHLETGYVNVDEEKGAELFYYFTKSERNPGEDPFLIWLSGGPGCTGLNGLLFEIGPFEIIHAEYKGGVPGLKYRNYTWSKIANIIYVDSPVGAGFSYSTLGNDDLNDLSSSYRVRSFIFKWFKDRPEFASNPLYIAGNSYAGKVIPIIAHMLAQDIEVGKEPLINLKGYLIGNGFTGDKVDINSRVPFAHGMGLISDELALSIRRSCRGQDHRYPQTEECAKNLEIFATFHDEINSDYILDPKCPKDPPFPNTTPVISSDRIRSLKEHTPLFDPPSLPDLKCRNYVYFLSYYWANYNATREALHIREGTIGEWVRCRRTIIYDKNVENNLEYHFNLTKKGYRAIIFSGDHDFVVPFMGSHQWIKSFKFPAVDEWRSWHVGGQVAGYTVLYSNNLTFATVKGAGHTSQEYKSEEGFNMFKRWISDEPL